jgi:hypothetical protein
LPDRVGTDSDPRTEPFVALNAACVQRELFESELFGHVKGAFTGATDHHKGLFGEAQGGTLFIDEVAELPMDTQAKLLRPLESHLVRPVGAAREQPSDVRIVALVRSHAQSVAAFLDRKVLYPVEGKTLSFVEWGRGATYERSVRAVDSATAALLTRECRVLVITAAGLEVAPTTARRGRVIYTTPRKPMSGDRFRVWLLSAPPSARCPQAR